MTRHLADRVVVVAGSTSAAGIAVVKELAAAGARVAAADLLEDRVRELASAHQNVTGYVCNLADAGAVNDLARQVRKDLGPIDGLIHLVGGWRGGGGIQDQLDADWDFLHTSVLTTLRNTSRAFYADLAESPVGRLAIVSAEAAANPTADGAAYAAVKCAAEAWTLAVADGFRRTQSGTAPLEPLTSAAVVLVVKALVDDKMRAAEPHRKFPGFTDVSVLATVVSELFQRAAADVNGKRLPAEHVLPVAGVLA
ncbi:SDR family oxidoreductase [Arthrobacter ginkgonis]|uniref:SDR family oxidoreductase n=1 Tax=Arthrobacter ginkgonis TaxID=1630594 RepID=A0ABP7D432_9MICC